MRKKGKFMKKFTIFGFKFLFEVKKNIPNWVEKTLNLEEEKIGLSNVGFDLRSMQHERLYSRLYMS